jgi:RsiW-degrading membrane proteinase PrsW (M82 family)
MPIIVVCACNKRLRAPDQLAGKRVKCPACGAMLEIPLAEPFDFTMVEDPPAPEPAPEQENAFTPPEAPRVVARSRGKAPSVEKYREILDQKPAHAWQDFTYLFMVLALIPLFFVLFIGNNDSPLARLEQTISHSPPEVQARIERLRDEVDSGNAEIETLIDALPNGRLEGAHLSRTSKLHYVYGLLAIGCYFLLGLFLLRAEDSHPWQLLLIGLFTGTFGIAFLLLAQFLASVATGFTLISGNPIIMLIFWVAWAIGFSYHAALDPSFGFFSSLLGFTFGVGLCEEVCKALPLLSYYRRPGATSWHKACTWGFSSGVGFGIAEAIMYSGNHYNGILPVSHYVVRFVSCITLHAMWAVSTAMFIHRHPDLIRGADSWHSYIPRTIAIVSVPMFLHGLYDTALKKELNAVALVAALMSFAWLIYCMETGRDFVADEPKRKRRRKLTPA